MVQSPSLIDHTTFNHTIEAKITKQASRLTLTDNKPFNSNTERFKHYSKKQSSPADGQPKDAGILTELNTNKRLKRLVMITVKVRVPFETSSSKFK